MKNVHHLKNIRNKLVFFVRLNRPIGIPLMSLVLIAGAVSISGLTVPVALKSVLISVLIGYIGFAPNDYADRKTDQQNPRKGGWQGAKAIGQKAKIAKYATALAAALALGLTLILPQTASLSLLGLTALSLMYSLPPVRLKSVPVLDSTSNAVMAYLGFTLGVGLAGGTFSSVINGAFWYALVFAGGGHALGTLLDLEPDRKAGINTIGTFLGWKKVLGLIQSAIITALVMERWSPESRTFLILTFLGLLYPAYSTEKESLEKMVYIGIAGYVIYGIIWIYLRT